MSFFRGLARAKERKLERLKGEEEKKLRIKMFKAKIEEEEKTKQSVEQFLGLIKGKPGTTDIPAGIASPEALSEQAGIPAGISQTPSIPGLLGEAPPPQAVPGQPAVPGQTLLEALSTPEGQALALRSGLFKGTDITKLTKEKEAPFGGALAGMPGLQFQGLTIGEGGKRKLKFGIAQEDKPLKANELLRFQNKQGQNPATGMTLRQVTEAGFKPISVGQENLERSSRGAKAVLQRQRGLLEKLYPPGGIESPLDRFAAIPEQSYKKFTQSDPTFSLYESFRKGTLAPLIRSMGEKGNLATEDINRAIELVPKLWPIPDTREVAFGKISQLEDWLAKATVRANEVEFKKTPSLKMKGPTIKGGRVSKPRTIDFSELP